MNKFIEFLKALHDYYAAHSESARIPYSISPLELQATLYLNDDKDQNIAELKRFHTLGHAIKEDQDSIRVEIPVGPGTLSIIAFRHNVCELKRVGTKLIEEENIPAHVVPEHEEDVYEYECLDSVLGISTEMPEIA